MDLDVVVVGAGLAGLRATERLTADGFEVALFEAQEGVGGRIRNQSLGEGKIVEVGGQWIGPGQERLAQLARGLDVATFPTYDIGENVVEWGGKIRRYRGTVPQLGPLLLADVGQVLWRLNRMAKKVSPESPWATPAADRWDRQTLHSWLQRNSSPPARRLVELGVQTIWGASSQELSLLHVLFYINAAGSFEALTDVQGGAQQDRFVGGSHELPRRLAQQLDGRVHLNSPVERISSTGGGIVVSGGGFSCSAQRVIVALPPALATRIAYEPALPSARDQLCQRMAQGAIIKCAAVYGEPFWREQGLTGQGLSDRGPVSFTADNSPPEGSPGVLLGFVDGAPARAFNAMPADSRRKEVLGAFERMFGPAAAQASDYIEQDWTREAWIRGGPVGNMGPGVWTSVGPALRAPIGRIHWAGTETATSWCGYMEGALQSADRAVQEVRGAVGVS